MGPRRNIQYPGCCAVVSGHAGSGDDRGNPEFSERQGPQCRPTEAFVHDWESSTRYKGIPLSEFQKFVPKHALARYSW